MLRNPIKKRKYFTAESKSPLFQIFIGIFTYFKVTLIFAGRKFRDIKNSRKFANSSFRRYFTNKTFANSPIIFIFRNKNLLNVEKRVKKEQKS